MRRSAALRWARLGLLVAAIVCTFGCPREGDLAAAGKSGPRPVETEPEDDPPPIKGRTINKCRLSLRESTYFRGAKGDFAASCSSAAPKEDPVEEQSVEENPTEKNPLAGCQQCHVDVEDEYFVSLHFKEKVSCKDCHGPSEGHLADENNEVKPDEMFARKDVDRLCGKCHECSRATAAESPADRSKVCTDCHGPHDLAPVPLAASQ